MAVMNQLIELFQIFCATLEYGSNCDLLVISELFNKVADLGSDELTFTSTILFEFTDIFYDQFK